MKTLALLIIVCALAGCSTTGPTVTQEVEVPVAVSCIRETPERPSYPFQEALASEDMFSKVKKALAEIELRKAYESKLEAVISACKI